MFNFMNLDSLSQIKNAEIRLLCLKTLNFNKTQNGIDRDVSLIKKCNLFCFIAAVTDNSSIS